MLNFLKESIKSTRFFCSAELVLGRDHSIPDAEVFIRDASREKDGIKVISLTDLPGGNPALPPEAFVSHVLKSGLTPLPHMTGKDGNRSFIEARLHSMARLGVENQLALTGDIPGVAFQGQAKPVFDLDSVLILWLVQAMKKGIEYRIGKRIIQTTPFPFFPGAVVNPFKQREPDQMMQLYKLELKIAAGAEFIITQLGFNIRKLYETKQYLVKQGLERVPLIANVYLPTAFIAKMMRRGDIAGCTVTNDFIGFLEGKDKSERLEFGALYLAAVNDLGFAGAHLGGFGLTHLDLFKMIQRSREIGATWRDKIEELKWESRETFYLYPESTDGLSDSSRAHPSKESKIRSHRNARIGDFFHRNFVSDESKAGRFLRKRISNSREDKAKSKFWDSVLQLATGYRKLALGCVGCGDCIQDYLDYSGCTMRWCYKNLRNGPCGGSRQDGSCEADSNQYCIWNEVYENTVSAGGNPRKFAETLIPPRDWCLDQTNALANRLAGLDNYCHREKLEIDKIT